MHIQLVLVLSNDTNTLGKHSLNTVWQEERAACFHDPRATSMLEHTGNGAVLDVAQGGLCQGPWAEWKLATSAAMRSWCGCGRLLSYCCCSTSCSRACCSSRGTASAAAAALPAAALLPLCRRSVVVVTALRAEKLDAAVAPPAPSAVLLLCTLASRLVGSCQSVDVLAAKPAEARVSPVCAYLLPMAARPGVADVEEALSSGGRGA